MRRAEPTASAPLNWSRILSATLLLSLICASTAFAIGACFLVADPAEFWADNAMPAATRLILVAMVLLGGLVGLTISGLTVLLRKSAGVEAIVVLSHRFVPLTLLWAISALATNYVWQENKLTFLLLLGATVFLLERSLWVSGMTFSHNLLDGMSERHARLSSSLRRLCPLMFVVASALAYSAYVGYWSIEQHHRLATASFDLGIFDNVAFNIMEGNGPRATVKFGPKGGSIFTVHSTFIMHLLAPFYWLSPRAETLLVIQSALVGLAAVPLYGFAATKLPRWSAAFVSVAYLLYAPLHGLNLYDFHCLPLCIFFLFSLFWALATNRTVLVWLLWGICVSVREDVRIGLAALGVFLMISGHRVRTGAWMAMLSGISFLLFKFVVIPMGESRAFVTFYAELLPEDVQSYRGVFMTMLTNPAYVLSTLLTQAKLTYALHLLAPLVFLPLRRWAYLWLLLPGALITLLPSYAPLISINFHYTALWIPYLFAAVALALAGMGRSGSGVVHRRASLTALLVGVVLHSLYFGAILRPTNFMGGNREVPFHVTEAERARYRDLREVIAMIPDEASVAATDRETPHISNRPTAYPFRMGAGDADYLLIREFVQAISRTQAQFTIDEHPYGLLAQVGEFYLFKRDHESPETLRALSELGLKVEEGDE